MKRIPMDWQVRSIAIFHHLVVLYALFFVHWEIKWCLLSVLLYLLFSRVGIDIGFHRYLCHRSFQTSSGKKNFLLLLGSLDGKGSSLAWVGTHLLHHKFSDTPGDPHSPNLQSPFAIWFNWLPSFKIPGSSIAHLLKDSKQVFFHRHYIEIIAGFCLLLGLVGFQVLLYGYSLPQVISFHTSGLVNVVGHLWGTRANATSDNSQNNKLVNWLTIGAGLHNNHHAFPEKPGFALQKGEWDLVGWLIEKFFALKQ